MGFLKKLLLVGVTAGVSVTFTCTATGAGHSSAPGTQPSIGCQVRIV